MKDIDAEIELQCARLVEYLSSAVGASTPQGYARLYRRIADALAAQITLQSGFSDMPDGVCADSAVIEVVDKESGRLFRHEAELGYEQNSNGLMLHGEDVFGNSSTIAFLSELALQKISDVTGRGPDKGRCD